MGVESARVPADEVVPTLDIGPVRLKFEGQHAALAKSVATLFTGYSLAPALQSPPRHRARVVLRPYPEVASCGALRSDPSFHYRESDGAYIASNALVHMELSVLDDETLLDAGVRPGEQTGGYFPDYLMRIATSAALVQAGALLVHACAMVSPEGEGVLFLGASGDGKTTMTRRLPGWRVLADDTALIDTIEGPGPLLIRGTPYAGREGLPRSGESAPLRRLMILHPGADEVSCLPVGAGEGFAALVRRVFCPLVDGPIPQRILALAHGVVGDVPVYRLASNLSHELAPLLSRNGAH